MKKSGLKISFLLTLATWVAGASIEAAGTSAAQFLKLGAGARAAALGDAYVSVADEATAAYWNPAGLAQIKALEVALMHNSWLQDTNYQFVSAAQPFGKSAIGLSVYRLDYGSIESYSASDVKGADFDAGSLATSFSFGTRLRDSVYLGVSAKHIRETIETESASSFAGDFGVLYKGETWNVGAVVQHVGSGLKMVQESFKLPQTVRVGVSRQLMSDRLLMSVGVSKPNDNDLGLHVGTEYKLSPIVALRGGYSGTPGNSLDVDGLTGLTGGLGVKFGRLGLDYALAPFGDLGLSHRVSFRFSFVPFAY